MKKTTAVKIFLTLITALSLLDFCSCHRCMCFWVGCALEKKQRIIMNVDSVLRRAL